MRVPGFTGPSYTLQSPQAAAERTVNLYPEIVERPNSKTQAILLGTPGLTPYVDLGTGEPVRALFTQDGRTGAVSGDGFFEVFGPGLAIRRGAVARDIRPATIASNGLNGNQWCVTSGGQGYVWALDTNAFAVIADADFPRQAVMLGYLDGYMLALTTAGVFFISALNNATSWAAADSGTRSQASDTWRALVVEPPNLWFWGSYTGEVWYDNGSSDFPWAPIPNAVFDVGIAAPFSATPFDQGMAWLAQTRAGGRFVAKSQQYAPTRLSTHGVEAALERYGTVEDAIGWTEAHFGHLWYVLTFPTAQATWVYDAATQLWHERGYWPGTGAYEAHLGRCHAMIGNTHLVGSRVDGQIYQLDAGVYDDAGQPIRRVRRPPRLYQGHQRLFHGSVELAAETGAGPATVLLRWSDDGGVTWSSDHEASTGPVGAVRTRLRWQRLGQSRDRVYEFVTSDPARVAWFDAFVEVEAGRH